MDTKTRNLTVLVEEAFERRGLPTGHDQVESVVWFLEEIDVDLNEFNVMDFVRFDLSLVTLNELNEIGEESCTVITVSEDLDEAIILD